MEDLGVIVLFLMAQGETAPGQVSVTFAQVLKDDLFSLAAFSRAQLEL